jgi:hypothetical protein
MSNLFWIAAIWSVSLLILALLYLTLVRHETEVWDKDRPVDNYILLLLFVLFAPLAAAIGFVVFVYEAIKVGPKRTWAVVTRQPPDPFDAEESDWIEEQPINFAGDLIRHRKLYDTRLKNEKIDDWMMWQIGASSDAMMLDIVTMYLALKSSGLEDDAIWEKFEGPKKLGRKILSTNIKLEEYLSRCLSFKDPAYLELPPSFIDKQISYCVSYANHRLKKLSKTVWPPPDWFDRRLDKFEVAELRKQAEKFDANAPFILSRLDMKIGSLFFLMLPGDEIWKFSSPQELWSKRMGRAGIALMRNGGSIAYSYTEMN